MKSYLLTLSPAAFCHETEACIAGREFAVTQPTMADVWDNCPRVDWLVWVLDALGASDAHAKPLRLFACAAVRKTPLGDGRTVWDLLTDPRSFDAVEVAERFANGEATREELRAARAAAYAVAANAVAANAADAAANAAAVAANAAAAYAVAYAAAYAADAARKFQVDLFRSMIPNPFQR